MELVDIGANLGHESFDRDREQVLARAREVGVVQIVVTGASETESATALGVARAVPGVLFATAGVHPHHAREWHSGSAAALERLAAEREVVAIGETGLDFNRDFSPRPDQERALEAHLELAAGLGMPVFLHERDAHERFPGHRRVAGVPGCLAPSSTVSPATKLPSMPTSISTSTSA